jgi:hypothetical protein
MHERLIIDLGPEYWHEGRLRGLGEETADDQGVDATSE